MDMKIIFTNTDHEEGADTSRFKMENQENKNASTSVPKKLIIVLKYNNLVV